MIELLFEVDRFLTWWIKYIDTAPNKSMFFTQHMPGTLRRAGISDQLLGREYLFRNGGPNPSKHYESYDEVIKTLRIGLFTGTIISILA